MTRHRLAVAFTTGNLLHIIARRTGTSERPTTTSITLKGPDGQQRVMKP